MKIGPIDFNKITFYLPESLLAMIPIVGASALVSNGIVEKGGWVATFTGTSALILSLLILVRFVERGYWTVMLIVGAVLASYFKFVAQYLSQIV